MAATGSGAIVFRWVLLPLALTGFFAYDSLEWQGKSTSGYPGKEFKFLACELQTC